MATYTDRPWTKNYDEHVPASLEPYPDKVAHDYISETAAKKPNATALLTSSKVPVLGRLDTRVTYRELDEASNALAAGLVDMGLKKGDRVAIVMPNMVAFAVSYWGILKAGGVVSATNPTYPPKKMAYQINNCDAEIVICLSLFYNLIKQIQPETKVKKVIVANIKEYFHGAAKFLFTVAMEKKDGHRVELKRGDDWFQDILAKYKGQKANVKVSKEDIAFFQYTGGTTGVSKGAMVSHSAVVANSMQMQTWTGFNAGHYDHIGQLLFIGAIPMFHVYGLVALLTQCGISGHAIILVPNPRDINELVDIIDHYKPHAFLGVPAMFNALNNHARVQSGEVSLKSIILNVSGSAPLPTKTKEEYDVKAGTGIIEGYGMSETTVASTANPFKGKQKINSVGMPYPDIDFKIVSMDDPDEEMPFGEVGELAMSGPNIMSGYHGMPTETKNVLRPDKNGKVWLYSGDIAYMDEDGYFHIVDRKKDMALIGGFNVYPASIENALKQHPAVFEVGVAAIPHPEKEGQEALKAWIVLKPGTSATEAELSKHCGNYLANYEIPRRFTFVDELPKTEVGKTLRRELIRMEMEEAAKLGQ
jgi:long-chain acyl-CoA synthetase